MQGRALEGCVSDWEVTAGPITEETIRSAIEGMERRQVERTRRLEEVLASIPEHTGLRSEPVVQTIIELAFMGEAIHPRHHADLKRRYDDALRRHGLAP